MKIRLNISCYRKPYRIEQVDFKTPVEEVFSSDLHISEKKDIVNKNAGLLEKKYNKTYYQSLL